MGDNSHFFGKSVNMLGFFLKERQRNKHWEIAVFMFGFFDFFIKSQNGTLSTAGNAEKYNPFTDL